MNECARRRRGHLTAAVLALGLFSLSCESTKAVIPSDELPKSSTVEKMPPWGNRLSKEGGFPCDVDQVLALSCRRCHYEPTENDAPFPLMRYEHIEVIRSGKPIRQLMEQMVAADLMPPLDEPVVPKVTPLTPGQKSTLLDWLKAGAPKNAAPCP